MLPDDEFVQAPCDVEIKYDELGPPHPKALEEFVRISSTNEKFYNEANTGPASGHDWRYRKINYRFNEPALIEELRQYVDSTYSQHYAAGAAGFEPPIEPIQTNEFIMSQCTTTEPLKHSVMKYAARYGKKEGYNRKDLMKILHYTLLWLNYHDKFYGKK